MPSKTFVHNLSTAQRDLLIRHIDRAVDVVICDQPRSREALLKTGLLKPELPGPQPKPRRTVLTEKGRRAVAMILAEYAEALVAAGYLEAYQEETPMQVLQRLKAAQCDSQTNPAKSPNLKNSVNPDSSSELIGR
jgi:hypothetical protein